MIFAVTCQVTLTFLLTQIVEFQAARVRALGDGRVHIAFEDLLHFAKEVLQHRVLLNYDGQAENLDVGEMIHECVTQLPVEA